MKLEDQFAPLELAREMQAAGFPQGTAFAWYAEDRLGDVVRAAMPWRIHEMKDRVGPDGPIGTAGQYWLAPDGTWWTCNEGWFIESPPENMRRGRGLVCICAAPTVAELLEWLTAATTAHGLELCRRDGEYHVVYRARDKECRSSGPLLAAQLSSVLLALAKAGAIDPRTLR